VRVGDGCLASAELESRQAYGDTSASRSATATGTAVGLCLSLDLPLKRCRLKRLSEIQMCVMLVADMTLSRAAIGTSCDGVKFELAMLRVK